MRPRLICVSYAIPRRLDTPCTPLKSSVCSGPIYPNHALADKASEFGSGILQMGHLEKIRLNAIPVGVPWQHGMVERHGQVLHDIVRAITSETTVVGLAQIMGFLTVLTFVKTPHTRSHWLWPRALLFGLDERRVATCPTHCLDRPDDVSTRNPDNGHKK